MAQFEYMHLERFETIKKLNELGLQGWEIISANNDGFLLKKKLS
jgi:hypothetical protein